MRVSTVLGLAAGIFVSTAAFAGPEGTYNVAGTNPGGGGEYKGTVTVAKTGEVFKVTWKIGDDTFVGTGIGDDQFLSVGYKSNGNFGVALYVLDGATWRGVWAYAGAKETGKETWMAR
jgi:hypothetical protein